MSNNTKRIILAITGTFIVAFSTALSVKAALGLAPISTVPYAFSLKFTKISYGTHNTLINLFFVLVQLILLRKKFPLKSFFQIVLAFSFGFFLDFSLFLIRGFEPESYIEKMITLILSCLTLGLGVSISLIADWVMTPGDNLVKVISEMSGLSYGLCKILFDCTMCLGCAVFSLLFFSHIVGLREGTIILALATGHCINMFVKLLSRPLLLWIGYSAFNPKK